MNFDIKNIVRVGIINSLLLVISIVLLIINNATRTVEPLYLINDLVCLATIISALIYTFKGYGKSASNSYKVFFILFALYKIFNFASDIKGDMTGEFLNVHINEILLAIMTINALVLAFAKDLGKKKSYGLVCASLLLQLVSSIRMFILYSSFSAIVIVYIVQIVLAFVACTFVATKYADKESRGAKK